MYEHHRQSIPRLIDHFKEDPNVLALFLGGSVAKGLARPDSDLDAGVVVTPEYHARLAEEGRLAECISGECTYEGGYFDIKYYTVEFLEAAAEHGSEPARNAFLCSQCLFTRQPRIAEIVERIPVFQEQEREEKLLSFYSAMSLNMNYFWAMSENDLFLRMRAAVDIVHFGLRMLLEEERVLFPCPKSLFATVERLAHKSKDICEKANCLLRGLDDASKNDFVDTLLGFLTYQPPEALSDVLTRYVDDFEQWWYHTRPFIAEW